MQRKISGKVSFERTNSLGNGHDTSSMLYNESTSIEDYKRYFENRIKSDFEPCIATLEYLDIGEFEDNGDPILDDEGNPIVKRIYSI